MKLIVGLGNPGSEYDNTRHNVGFSLIDYISLKWNVCCDKKKFNGNFCEFFYNGEKIILLKPLSYMNLSGGVVLDFVNYYKIDLKDILIIQDDLDMNFGRIKFVFNSSCGGHNGIRDIENKLGSRLYLRLKIGISNDKDIDTKDYVLGKFNSDEVDILKNDYKKLDNLVEDFCNLGIDSIMSKYNNK